MTKPTTLVIYHSNCLDGLMAAALCFDVLGNDAVYAQMQYTKLDEDYLNNFNKIIQKNNIVPEETELLLVDFSIPFSVAGQLNFASFTILDHHASAIKRWDGIALPCNFDVVFNTKLSGCGLVCEYFKGRIAPELVNISNFVQDRDLWLFKLKDTVAITAQLSIKITLAPEEFWSYLLQNGIDALRSNGNIIVEYRNYLIESLARHLDKRYSANLDVQFGIVSNVPSVFMSEYCHQMLDAHPELAFIAVVFMSPKGDEVPTIVSFRSREKGYVVNGLAEAFGGGGHPGAASCTVKHLSDLMAVLN